MSVCEGDFIAYLEVEDGKCVYDCLYDHSLLTAKVGLVIYERELDKKLRELFMLSALLHDVGKANDVVKKRWNDVLRNGGKVSFRCHELLSAQVVLELRKMHEAFEEVYEPVFYAVLRHHHAMRMLRECNDSNLTLDDVGKLAQVIPSLKDLKGTKAVMSTIIHETDQLIDKKNSFILAGYVSLADSVAALIKRRQDSSQKPSKFVRLALEERGLSPQRVEERIRVKEKELEGEIMDVVRKYLR